jgi:hypothetical protein
MLATVLAAFPELQAEIARAALASEVRVSATVLLSGPAWGGRLSTATNRRCSWELLQDPTLQQHPTGLAFP